MSGELTEEELAAALTALRANHAGGADAADRWAAPGDRFARPPVDADPFTGWRHRRLIALNQAPRRMIAHPPQ